MVINWLLLFFPVAIALYRGAAECFEAILVSIEQKYCEN